MGRREIHRVLGVKAEAYSLIGDVVTLKSPVEQRARHAVQLRIQPTNDDAPQWSGLSPPDRGPVRLDDESAVWVQPKGKAVPPEPVH